MTWDEIADDWWTIPAARTKNRKEHRVHLSALALETLNDVPRMIGESFVFAGRRSNRQVAMLNRVAFAFVRPRQKPRHAMRDTAASGMAAAGVPVDDVSRVLNHSVGLKVTQGYVAHAFDREKQIALTTWSRRLSAILEHAEPEAATVVPFVRI